MKKRVGRESFALVSTLLIVAVMALGALAFFQAARMDRLVTRNTAERVRAELAAESGLAAAQGLIQQTIGTSFQYVSAQDADASNNYLWSFTLGGNGVPVLSSAGPVRLVSTNTNPSSSLTNTIVIDSAAGIRRTVSAVEITNGTDTNRSIRYAFWVDDNSSCWNPIRSGTNDRLPGIGFGSLGLPYRTASGNSFSILPGANLSAWQSN
ncbi:MAG: hypothetical protein EBV83_09470, partial [Verrucomicrobia bacterium]|nr:hypothetical protein [Verrucomicrobiota bacterium]